ncbi:MAG TPA: hypothetical protein DCG38_10450 [Eubacteriaceae bacterium]|jgi:hypothetical protein|nr:hypothetical protein [Eubacteriaceae bacterium]
MIIGEVTKMDHERYIELISRKIDNDLDENEKKELDEHLQSCDECSKYYHEMKESRELLKGMVDYELGEHDKKQILKKMKDSKAKKTNFKKYLPYAAGIILVLVMVGTTLSNFFIMGRSNDSASDNSGGYNDFDSRDQWEEGISNEGASTDEDNKGQDGIEKTDSSQEFDVSKIIYRGNISLYSEDYKETTDKISVYVDSVGGFIQESNANYYDVSDERSEKSGYMIIRVPTRVFSETMNIIEGYGDAASSGVTSTNITQQYQDVQGELDSYMIQEERLLDYLSKAERIEDMLSIESELTRVRNEINSRLTLLKNWDKEVAYSTIHINIFEKSLPTSSVKSPFENFGKRAREAFVESINFLLKFIVDAAIIVVKFLPFAVAISASAAILGILIRKIRK